MVYMGVSDQHRSAPAGFGAAGADVEHYFIGHDYQASADTTY
jgi:hypothetical protein